VTPTTRDGLIALLLIGDGLVGLRLGVRTPPPTATTPNNDNNSNNNKEEPPWPPTS